MQIKTIPPSLNLWGVLSAIALHVGVILSEYAAFILGVPDFFLYVSGIFTVSVLPLYMGLSAKTWAWAQASYISGMSRWQIISLSALATGLAILAGLAWSRHNILASSIALTAEVLMNSWLFSLICGPRRK